jgi:hypothetical protein
MGGAPHGPIAARGVDHEAGAPPLRRVTTRSRVARLAMVGMLGLAMAGAASAPKGVGALLGAS